MLETLEGLTARQRALLAALLSAALIAYIMPIGTRPLRTQDEARVVLLAEDTLRHGLRLPARVRDAPYLNKPPLFFWTVALGAWPSGRVSDREAPIPSVAAALATLLGVFAIGREATTYPGRLEAAYPIRSFADRVRPSLDHNAPLLAYPDASLAFNVYLDHPIAEVSARETIAGRLQRPAAGAVLLRDAPWEDLRRTTHPSWCPVDRVNLGYRSFVLLGACR